MKVRERFEFPSWWRDGEFLAVIDIATDEGGNTPMLFVSTHVGETSEMRLLTQKWECRLAVDGVTHFHSKYFENYDRGPFVGLSAEKRMALLSSLADCVHEHGDFGITVGINCDLYDKMIDNTLRSQWGSAYTFAAQVGLLVVSRAIERDAPGDGVNILVEQGHRNCNQLIQELDSLVDKSGTRLNVKTVRKGQKLGNPVLQIADMLAYGMWRDGPIKDALSDDRGPYKHVFLWCSEELITMTWTDINAWIAKRKEWGLRRPRATAL